jgi:SP family general alpha glucoside:H+ symporter-like MFS transporter
VSGHYTEQKLEETVALMVHTNEMEKAEVAGTGFRDCFKGTNRRRTEIVSFSFASFRPCKNVADLLSYALCGVYSIGVEM